MNTRVWVSALAMCPQAPLYASEMDGFFYIYSYDRGWVYLGIVGPYDHDIGDCPPRPVKDIPAYTKRIW